MLAWGPPAEPAGPPGRGETAPCALRGWEPRVCGRFRRAQPRPRESEGRRVFSFNAVTCSSPSSRRGLSPGAQSSRGAVGMAVAQS